MAAGSPPLVSVILPTYNQIDFAEAAIRSAVEQDYPNLQVVVRDDGSQDGTPALVRELAARYPDRITLIDEGYRLGITANCNRILAECRGRYVACHAGDDLWLPGKVSRQVAWLEADERRVICGHDVEAFESESGRTLYRYFDVLPPRTGAGAEEWVRQGVLFAGLSLMVRASAMPAHRYDPRVPVASDWLLWIECLAAGGHYGYVDGVFARYRRHADNVTRTLNPTARDDLFVTLALVEARYPHLVASARHARAGMFRLAGLHAFRRGDVATARAYWRHSLLEKPEARALAALSVSMLPHAMATRVLNRLRPDLPV